MLQQTNYQWCRHASLLLADSDSVSEASATETMRDRRIALLP